MRKLPFLALLLAACSTANVAVKKDFDFAKVKKVAVVSIGDYGGYPGSGEIMAGAFEQELLSAGYSLVERAQVDKVLAEKRLAPEDRRAGKELARRLHVDAILLGRIVSFREPHDALVESEVVDTFQDPIYQRRVKTVQNADGTTGQTETTELTGYRTKRVVRREPRTVTSYGRLGASARLVYVTTGEVLWSGSYTASVFDFEEAARAVAGAILKAVKKTWPSQLK